MERERDLRVDFIRGAALFTIFVEHNIFFDQSGYRWMNAIIFPRYSLINGADFFFLFSGYVSGIVYGGIFISSGLVACLIRAGRRCLQLYVAEVFLAISCLTAIRVAVLRGVALPLSVSRYFHDATLATVLFKNAPPLLSILPMYIIFIGLTPLALYLWMHYPRVLAAASIACYLAASFVPGIRSWSNIDGFNVFAWQALFFCGLVVGHPKACNAGWSWAPGRKLLYAAAGGLLLIAFLRLAPSERLEAMIHSSVLRQAIPWSLPLAGKANLELLRLVNLGLWIVAIAAVKPSFEIRNWVSRGLVVCGQNSLVVFCGTVFLNYLGAIWLGVENGRTLWKFVWTLASCGLLFGVAARWNWFCSEFGGGFNRAVTMRYRNAFSSH